MKEFFTKNLVSLIVVGLLVILYLQRCSQTPSSPTTPQDTHDTLRVEYHYYHDSTIYSKPTIVNNILPIKETIPKADTTYAGLKKQYDSLASLYYSTRIQYDSARVDSIGYVTTLDTVNQNVITGRKWHFNIRERLIETTITNNIYQKSKTQVYIGGLIHGSQELLISGVGVGGFLKNKKDQVYALSVQKLNNQPITYGAGMYWKIKLKK